MASYHKRINPAKLKQKKTFYKLRDTNYWLLRKTRLLSFILSKDFGKGRLLDTFREIAEHLLK